MHMCSLPLHEVFYLNKCNALSETEIYERCIYQEITF